VGEAGPFRDSRPTTLRRTGTNEWARQIERMAVATWILVLLPLIPNRTILVLAGVFALVYTGAGHVLVKNTLRPEEELVRVPYRKLMGVGTILFLMILFRDKLFIVGAAWATTAFGDGAATLVGIHRGRHPLPWNRAKTVEGSLAFLAAGSIAAALAIRWIGVPGAADFTWLFSLLVGLAAGASGALIESAPLPIDDNISVPAIVAMVVALASFRVLLSFFEPAM
jgi:dolichol kinase